MQAVAEGKDDTADSHGESGQADPSHSDGIRLQARQEHQEDHADVRQMGQRPL